MQKPTSPERILYSGVRDPATGVAHVGVFTEAAGYSRPLPMCYHIRSIGCDGPCWGWDDPGTDQLALALCFDALGADTIAQYKALAVYKQFSNEVVQHLDVDDWVLSREEVLATLKEIEQQRGKGR